MEEYRIQTNREKEKPSIYTRIVVSFFTRFFPSFVQLPKQQRKKEKRKREKGDIKKKERKERKEKKRKKERKRKREKNKREREDERASNNQAMWPRFFQT